MGNFISSIIDSGINLVKSYFPPDLTPEQKQKLNEGLLKFKEHQMDSQTELLKVQLQYYQLDNKLIRSVRPILTYFLAGSFNVALIYGLLTNKVTYQEYMTSMGPINSLLLGFWFGERSALKDPKKQTDL